MVGKVVWMAAAILSSGVALAQDSAPEVGVATSPPLKQKQGESVLAKLPYPPVVEEHSLRPADSTPSEPIAKYDNLNLPDASRGREFTWFERHLELGRTFADPFLGSEVFPEVSAGLSVFAAGTRPTGAVAFGSGLNVNLFFVDLVLPLISRLDGTQSDERMQVNFKLPIPLPNTENHRFAFIFGNGFGASGGIPVTKKAEMLYGMGYGGFGLQLNASWRLEPFSAGQQLSPALGYGALFAYRVGGVEPMLELSGLREFGGGRGDRIDFVPGLRFYPGDRDNLQFGVGAIVGTGGNAGDFSDFGIRRLGGIADVSYNFF